MPDTTSIIIKHSPWMIYFPFILFVSSFFATFGELFTDNETILQIAYFLFNGIIIFCVLEPLNHSFFLFVKLGLLYESMIGIVLLPVWRIIKYSNDTFYVSGDRLKIVSGAFLKTRKNIPADMISEISVKQEIYGRCFNYGDILMHLKDGSVFTYRYVRSPVEAVQKINRMLQQEPNM